MDLSQPMTVVRLEVDSFKRMRAARLTPTPTGLIQVRGPNEAGKSSLIESMLAALLGKDGTQELPITEGAHGGHVVLDLGALVIRRTWTRDSGGDAKTKLVVENAQGVPVKSPQAILENLVGHFVDPVAFLSMKPDEQVKAVLSVLGLDGELARLETKAAGQFDHRRDLGREMERTAKHAQQLQLQVEGLPTPTVTGTAEELAQLLRAAKDNNAAVEALRTRKANAERVGKEAAARVERLKTELALAEAAVVEQQAAWTTAAQELKGCELVDVEPIMQALRDLEAAQQANARRALLVDATAAALAAKGAHDEADAALEATRTEIQQLLAGTKFPVETMAYDWEKKLLTVGGIPISQASQGQGLKISCAIAMAGKTPIRIFFIRSGSLLDHRNLEQVARDAHAKGWQVWCEIVADERGTGPGVWIEDGEAFEGPGSSTAIAREVRT